MDRTQQQRPHREKEAVRGPGPLVVLAALLVVFPTREGRGQQSDGPRPAGFAVPPVLLPDDDDPPTETAARPRAGPGPPRAAADEANGAWRQRTGGVPDVLPPPPRAPALPGAGDVFVTPVQRPAGRGPVHPRERLTPSGGSRVSGTSPPGIAPLAPSAAETAAAPAADSLWHPRSGGKPAAAPAPTEESWLPAAHNPEGPALEPPARPRPAPVEPAPPVLPPNLAQKEPVEEAPPPRRAEAPPGEKPDGERAILLGAARNAASARKWEQALQRYEEYFRRYGTSDLEVRREYAGVLVQAGRNRDALQLLQQLLAQGPADVKLRILAADVAILNREFKQAIAILTPALRQEPDNFEVATRLARAHVFDDDFLHALQVFDQYLSRLRPGDPKTPITFPALLVDLERPAEALAFLNPLLEKNPGNLDLLAIRVRAWSRLYDRGQSLETLTELASKKTAEALKVRQDLADTLYASGDFDLAQVAYHQILEAEPGNVNALLGAARVAMSLFQPQQARRLLESVVPTEATRRSYLLAKAEYHQVVGEYIDAKRIYECVLHENENDHDVRLSLGKLYEQPLREDERAKAEYGKIPPTARPSRRARVAIASALTNQRFFAEAAKVCRAVLAEYPGDGGAMGQLVRTLSKGGHTDEAVAQGRAFVEANARNLPAVLTVHLALGKALLDAHSYPAAVSEYEQALALPGGRLPAAFYGLAVAAEKQGRPEVAHQTLADAASLNGGDARNRLLLADLFDADANDQGALEMILAVLKWDPENLAALIRLVTTQSRLARFSGQPKDTVQTAKLILALSPTNVPAHLEMARSLASGQKFTESAHAYEQLIAIDPGYRRPRRERARVLQSNQQFAAAQAAFQELLTPSAEQMWQAALEACGQRDPRVRQAAETHLHGAAPPDPLAFAAPHLPVAVDADVSQVLQRLYLDYQARSAEQAVDRLEAEEKAKSWLPYADIKVSKQLLELEPSNSSVLFDLGQYYGTLKETHNAIETYGEDLQVDPREREAGIASERANFEMDPQFPFGFTFFGQTGRGGLADVRRLRWSTEVRLPYGDENEWVSFGFSRVDYIPSPSTGRSLQGNIISLGFQTKAWDRLYVYGLGNYEAYRDRISDRVTFDTGVRYNFCDQFQAWTGMFLNNVVENGGSIAQNIYRYGSRTGLDFLLTRRWAANATYTYARYSDRNDYNEAFFTTSYLLNLAPKELKFVLFDDMYGYHNTTIFPNGNQNDILFAIHPYFAPHYFNWYGSRLEWKQWLSRDYFVHADQCWYSLQAGVSWDNEFNIYYSGGLALNYDVKPWLTVGTSASFILSPVYDAYGAFAYLVLRCPYGWH